MVKTFFLLLLCRCTRVWFSFFSSLEQLWVLRLHLLGVTLQPWLASPGRLRAGNILPALHDGVPVNVTSAVGANGSC